MAVDFLKARPGYDFGLPIRQVGVPPTMPRAHHAWSRNWSGLGSLSTVTASATACWPARRPTTISRRSFSTVFGQAFKEILSGCRVFSRRAVKSFPVLSERFEIETELTVHALELSMPVAEVETSLTPARGLD
jgi:hypothetical protein